MSAHELKIRLAEPRDETAVRALTQLLWEHHHARDPARFRPAADIMASTPNAPPPFEAGQYLAVADASGLVVGYVRAVARKRPESFAYLAKHVAIIQEIAVTPEQRGRGIGRALLEAAVAWARAQGCAGIEVPVFAFNHEAMALYRSLGFSEGLVQLELRLG